MFKMIKTGISYYGSHFSDHIEDDMKNIAKHNCSYIVIAASEFDLGFYFPSIKKIAEIAKKNGLEVFLDFWAHGGTFGGEAASFFVMHNPRTCQISNRKRWIPSACHNNPRFQGFMLRTIEKCCTKLDIDGIFIDEPHFYFNPEKGVWGCRCRHCKSLFRKKYGTDMPTELTKQVKKFRYESSKAIIKKFCSYIKEINPKLLVTVCSKRSRRPMLTGVKWGDVCSLPSVDIFGSTTYWVRKKRYVKPESRVGKITQAIVNCTKRYGKKSEVWVQLFRLGKGREDEIARAIDIAASYKPDRIATWTFKGAENSILSCADPAKAWKILGKVYEKLRKQK